MQVPGFVFYTPHKSRYQMPEMENQSKGLLGMLIPLNFSSLLACEFPYLPISSLINYRKIPFAWIPLFFHCPILGKFLSHSLSAIGKNRSPREYVSNTSKSDKL